MYNPSIIDQIYEAAFVTEHWETVCVKLSEEARSYSASLITLGNKQSFQWVSSPNVREDMERFSQSPLRFQNVRPARHFERTPFSFMRDTDLMSEDEIATDPIYTEFLRPIGLGWTVGDMFQEPSGHTIIFDLIRRIDAGPFQQEDVDRLNALRPHLARAATMTSRLQFERINAAVQALELVGLPAAVITSGGKVLAANSLLEQFAPQLVITAYDMLIFGFADTNLKFSDTLSRGRFEARPAGCSLPLPRTETQPPAVVHLVPVRGNARDIFTHAAYFLVATSVDRSKVLNSETLQGLFDLSPAEARVARSLAAGNDVMATARQFGLGVETVRTHVKSALSKCGMSRQTDLVASIASLSPLSPTDQDEGAKARNPHGQR